MTRRDLRRGTSTSTDLTTFYTQYGPAGLSATLISDHVSQVMDVDQIALYGGGVGGQIGTIARAQLGQPVTNFCGNTVGTWTEVSCALVDSPGNPEWCAAFASYVWNAAGVSIPSYSGVSQFVAWGQAHGTLTQIPAVGDAAVWGSDQHVDIVVGVQYTGGVYLIQTVDGNYGSLDVVMGDGGGWYNPNQIVGNTQPGPLATFVAPV